MSNVLDMTIEQLMAELRVTESFTQRGFEIITALELKRNVVWNNKTKEYEPKMEVNPCV
ncbi:hypothetical protein [Arachidicoccus sp.]|uniref:hypothetical protein n=1 Tax=Arachidicoccus sp. TaxID=1872624 RepID=UPI003D2556AE